LKRPPVTPEARGAGGVGLGTVGHVDTAGAFAADLWKIAEINEMQFLPVGANVSPDREQGTASKMYASTTLCR
jgi:hypothetical protein